MASSAALSNSNLYTQGFWNHFNLLNNRSNVVDPVDASGNRKFVYADEPDPLASGFDGYPLVVVNPVSLSNGERRTLDSRKREVKGELSVEVWSSTRYPNKRTADHPLAVALTHLNDISDDIIQALGDVTNKQSLRDNGIKDVMIEDRGIDNGADRDGNKLFIREFNVTWNNALLTVSA